MRAFLAIMLSFGLLTVVVMLILSLMMPTIKLNKILFKTASRRKLAIYYTIVIFALFMLIGLIAPTAPVKQLDNHAQETTPPIRTAVTSSEKKPSKQPQVSNLYDVVRVIDGDTVDVSIGGKVQRIRLIGIDTPETVDPRKPVQCFGKEASAKAKELLEGKQIRLESDSSQDNSDKYGRLLRYVYLEDGSMYNKAMLSGGYAHEYTYNVPYKYQSDFRQAQKDAEQAGKGLWATTTCNGDTSKASQQNTPVTPPQAASPQPTSSQTSSCDPNYSPCIPDVSYDLDCNDIAIKVKIVGVDRYKLDRDGDGYGCDSY